MIKKGLNKLIFGSFLNKNFLEWIKVPNLHKSLTNSGDYMINMISSTKKILSL